MELKRFFCFSREKACICVSFSAFCNFLREKNRCRQKTGFCQAFVQYYQKK